MLSEAIWVQPWFRPWQQTGEAILQKWQSHPLELNNCFAKNPMAFHAVPQASLPEGEAYEAFIARTQTVPTRNNAHDFFNGLAWLRFPQTKQQLNRLQAQAINQQGVTAQRGALRDALTVFDENAALLCAPDVVWQALIKHDWQTLFVTHRQAWQEAHLTLFGHALLEKLLQPYKSITAHVLSMPVPPEVQAAGDQALDHWLSQWIQTDFIQTKPFVPIQVLGVPGWWPANENTAFYADDQVFRPQKKQGY
jgi:Protein of unknown function (DUF3025)